MTVKKQAKHFYEGLVIKIGSAQDRVGTSRKRRIGTIKQRDVSFENASLKNNSTPLYDPLFDDDESLEWLLANRGVNLFGPEGHDSICDDLDCDDLLSCDRENSEVVDWGKPQGVEVW